MTIQLLDLKFGSAPPPVKRKLLLIWRDPHTGRSSAVGHLDQLVGGRFLFSYSANASQIEGFFALDEYPDFNLIYATETLPVFFANRVMSSGRSSYLDYLQRLDVDQLSEVDIPIELLIRTGGGRATDTFHVVEAPAIDGGSFSSNFFVAGISHVDDAQARINELTAGTALTLRPEPNNPRNPRAVLLDLEANKAIGWVPDWLCGHVQDLMDAHYELDVRVSRVNKEAPLRHRVLCNVQGVIRKSSD